MAGRGAPGMVDGGFGLGFDWRGNGLGRRVCQPEDFFRGRAKPDRNAGRRRGVGIVQRRFAGVGDAGDLSDNVPRIVHHRRAARTGGKFGGHIQEEDRPGQRSVGMPVLVIDLVGPQIEASDHALGEHKIIAAGMAQAIDALPRPDLGPQR